MTVAQMDEAVLQEMLEGIIRSVVKDEILKLKLSLLPAVSDEELEQIKMDAGSPADYASDEICYNDLS